MLVHKSPLSLRLMCLNWYFNFMLNCNSRKQVEYNLPKEIINDLMKLLDQVDRLNIRDVYKMIEQHGHKATVLHLELTEWCSVSSEDIARLLQLISHFSFSNNHNANVLKHFSIYGHSLPWNNCDHLMKTIEHLNGLRVLKLYVHGLNDDNLFMISKSCRLLEQLYLQGMNFSNRAVVSLCGIQIEERATRNASTRNASTSQTMGCPNLRILMMSKECNSPPKFSHNAITCLLDNLPLIEAIQIPNNFLTSALIALSRTAIKQLPSLRYYHGNFSKAYFCDSDVISDIMEKLIYMCSHLTHVNISLDCSFSFLSLVTLSELKHLHTLVLTQTDRDDSISCEDDSHESENNEEVNNLDLTNNEDDHDKDEEVYQILSKLGHKLYHLELHNFMHVDLSLIGKFCPNLTTFEAVNVKQILIKRQNTVTNQEEIKSKRNAFACLKYFKLFAHCDNYISRNHLIKVLQNCVHLEYLMLGWFDAFDDHCLAKLLKENQMNDLGMLELHEMSHSLTIDGLMQIIYTRRKPLSLKLLYCEGITSEDINQLKKLIQELNLDLNIKCYSD